MDIDDHVYEDRSQVLKMCDFEDVLCNVGQKTWSVEVKLLHRRGRCHIATISWASRCCVNHNKHSTNHLNSRRTPQSPSWPTRRPTDRMHIPRPVSETDGIPRRTTHQLRAFPPSSIHSSMSIP